MKKITYASLVIFLLLFSACQKNEKTDLENNISQPQEPQKPMTGKEVADYIDQTYQLNNGFDWSMADNLALWSAALSGQNIISIGIGKDTGKSSNRPDVKAILNTLSNIEGKAVSDILIYQDNDLHYVDVLVTKLESIEALKQRKDLRYVEPTGYDYFAYVETKSNSGCSTGSDYISSADYGTLPSGAKVPWNYYIHKIDQAWRYSKGRGIGVGVIDTGISDYQPNLGYKFDDFYSGRYVQKYGTYIDSNWYWSTNYDGYHDKCGHGTSSNSAVAAPNNNNHLPVGVAYECNLVSYRGTADVVLNDYHERKGVTMALKALARRSDIKIISMSIGYPWSIGNIKDAVKYAYNHGKLIFAAGGTSTSYTNWYPVIFPASMSETVAVTGIEEGSGYNECDVCHTGSKIDFTYVMERGNNHHQPVDGYYNNTANYFGGSSVATASTAGIAALVWARYPYWSRSQVLDRLKRSAHFYPYKNSDFGYGNIDALKAVRGY